MAGDDADDCSICLGPLSDPVATQCNHVFCSACLRQSLQANPHCPLCRRRVTLLIPHRLRDGNLPQSVPAAPAAPPVRPPPSRPAAPNRRRHEEDDEDLEFVRAFNRQHAQGGLRENVAVIRHGVAAWIPILLFLAVLVYALMPVDLVPDAIPLVGLIDDVLFFGVSVFVLNHFAQRARQQIM